ncbi:MAG: hypothetical protein AAB323_02195 [Pseudomonadota bacterium]
MRQIWINVALLLGIGFMLPVYRYLNQIYQSVQTAKASGVWAQIPLHISTKVDYISALQKEAKSLSLKLNIHGATITVEASDPLQIYNFLHYMNRMPVLQVVSFTMTRKKGRVIASIKSVILEGRRSASEFMPQTQNPFYMPRFFYVNAATEVDEKKQIWVNGKNHGPSCPWPLYHTFDKQTGMVKKGDLRPRLSLTSGV